MFYSKLINIYQSKPYLEDSFPFNMYFPLLQHHIAKEISLNSNYVSPYRFSTYNGINLKSVLSLFISLSGEDGLFDRLYKYDCDCGTSHILKEEALKEFYCYNCGEEAININASLSNITLLFKLKSELEENMVQELKKASSSFENEDVRLSEEDAPKLEKEALRDIITDPEMKKQIRELTAFENAMLNGAIS